MNSIFIKIIKVLIIIVILLMATGWAGFKVEAKPFSFKYDLLKTKTIPTSDVIVPETLEKYVENIFSEDINQSLTSLVWGKAKINVKGLWMPGRFITYYIPGHGFFRYIEITWFGRPIIKGYDLYYDQVAEFSIAGQLETGETIEQGQNMALWAETIWTPMAFFTNKSIEWDDVNPYDVKLKIPFKESYDEISIHVDSKTGLIKTLRAMRFKGNSQEKVPWEIDLLEWDEFSGVLIPSESSVKWADEEKPWSYWSIEGVLYNVKISEKFEEEIHMFLDKD